MRDKDKRFNLSPSKIALITALTLPSIFVANISSAAVPTAAEIRAIPGLTPGQIQERISAPLFKAPKALGVGGPQAPEATSQKVPSKAKEITFVLKGITFEGNTVYSKQQLMKLYQKDIGKKISLAELYSVSDELTKKLRQDGYILSKAYLPPQHIRSGTATIKVVEGYIDGYSFKGETKSVDIQKDMIFLRAYAEKVMQARPLNISVLERYALLSNDLPGINARVVLAPSESTPGAANLLIYLNKKRFGGYISYNNRGTRYIGPQQIFAGGNVNNFLSPGSETGLRLVGTPGWDQLRYYQFYRDQYVGSNGLQLAFDASYTHSAPGFVLKEANILGTSKSWNFGASYPLIRSRAKNWFVEAEFNYLDSKSKLKHSSYLYEDRIRALKVGTTYNFADQYKGFNDFGFNVVRGIPVLNASKSNPPADKPLTRTDGNPIFTKFTASASRLQILPKHFSVQLAMKGQYAFNRLLSSQEFGYGGAQYGTAYDSSALSGDNGVAAKAELRWDMPVKDISQVQYFASYDYGVIWNKNIQSDDEPNRDSGSSLGLGMRLTFNSHLTASVEAAKPITLKIPAAIAQGGNRRPVRVFFNVSLQG